MSNQRLMKAKEKAGDGYAKTAPIKIRGFIFTHASGTVPRHAVLGVGVSNEVRARQRPRAMRALARAGSRAA